MGWGKEWVKRAFLNGRHEGDTIKLTDVRQEREHAITMKCGTSVIHTGHSLGKNLQRHECHLILVFTASLLVIRLAKAILSLFYSQALWLIRSKYWQGCATLRRTRSPSSNPVTWLLEYQYHTNYSKFKWKRITNEQKRRCSNFMFFSFLKGSSLKIAHLWVCNLCSGSFRLFYCLAFPNCKKQTTRKNSFTNKGNLTWISIAQRYCTQSKHPHTTQNRMFLQHGFHHTGCMHESTYKKLFTDVCREFVSSPG